jgi:hypothetical protein
MGYIDQFIASASFDKKRVLEFKDQSIWKAIFYVVLLVLVTEILVSIINPPAFYEELIQSEVMFHYVRILVVLIEHFLFISLLAIVGKSYNKQLVLPTYGQVWTITAYGISAPIFVRTVLQLTGFTFPGIVFIYWAVVGLFGIIVFRGE